MACWQRRATTYNNLEWVHSKQFIDAIITAGKFRASDIVLDAGTGTGIIASAIAPLVKQVVAIDISPHMLNLAPDNHPNVEWVVGDIRDLKLADSTFNTIVARYTFHHITSGTNKAMAECYRVLKHGGVMVFAEGVPPSQRTKQDFIDIFKLKEERLTFMPEDMVNLMTSVGFVIIHEECLWLKQMSIRKWLESGSVSRPFKEIIFKMHYNAPDYFKDDYRMTKTADDCLIDMKVEILTGAKY